VGGLVHEHVPAAVLGVGAQRDLWHPRGRVAGHGQPQVVRLQDRREIDEPDAPRAPAADRAGLQRLVRSVERAQRDDLALLVEGEHGTAAVALDGRDLLVGSVGDDQVGDPMVHPPHRRRHDARACGDRRGIGAGVRRLGLFRVEADRQIGVPSRQVVAGGPPGDADVQAAAVLRNSDRDHPLIVVGRTQRPGQLLQLRT
jgi:hypothetical protein